MCQVFFYHHYVIRMNLRGYEVVSYSIVRKMKKYNKKINFKM